MGLAGDEKAHSQLGVLQFPPSNLKHPLSDQKNPRLLPTSCLKCLSQHAQMFNLRKELIIILEKSTMLCCELCMARECTLPLSDFCQHFSQKEATMGGRVTFQVCKDTALLSLGQS